jgi:thiamine-phosphate pyrophosphorylase
MNQQTKIGKGVYLVLDPAMETDLLLDKLKQALEGGVQILQIWNNWPRSYSLAQKQALIEAIWGISSGYGAPLLINDEWQLLQNSELSGVHFDHIPGNFEGIKSEIKRDFIAGITCTNDLKVVEWAEKNHLDYISFCAMFPSSSIDSCELVQPETLKKAREITPMPIFISGGITTENMADLKDLDFSGVAVISGIMNADTPKKSALAYTQAFNQLKT